MNKNPKPFRTKKPTLRRYFQDSSARAKTFYTDGTGEKKGDTPSFFAGGGLRETAGQARHFIRKCIYIILRKEKHVSREEINHANLTTERQKVAFCGRAFFILH